MDIICVMWLLYSNGKIAQSRGQRPMKYRLLTMGLCFGLEILGSVAGMMISVATTPEHPTLKWAYLLGISGILIGAFLSRRIVMNTPTNHTDAVQMYQANMQYQTPAYGIQEEKLAEPATVRIVNEYYWNESTTDLFFLNGVPVCTLQPGKEYSFLVTSSKNIFSIGRPNYPTEDTEHTVKFVAAEKGYIEIVVKDSKIVADRFKNLKSK